mmetsp:Transcript_48020/g.89551  ORF Transcript_48020/g.89551 Transcript_48020/m.89551 type:complete len:80 (-) Transcript_48020:179-418(-)
MPSVLSSRSVGIGYTCAKSERSHCSLFRLRSLLLSSDLGNPHDDLCCALEFPLPSCLAWLAKVAWLFYLAWPVFIVLSR